MPSSLDWDRHEDEILDLFVTQNKPLAEVQKYMLQTHGFNATERQYKHRFPRLKNITGVEWVSIADEFQRRTAARKQTVVCLHGKPLPSDRVLRALGRAGSKAYKIKKQSSAARPRGRPLPERISFRTPPPEAVDGQNPDPLPGQTSLASGSDSSDSGSSRSATPSQAYAVPVSSTSHDQPLGNVFSGGPGVHQIPSQDDDVIATALEPGSGDNAGHHQHARLPSVGAMLVTSSAAGAFNIMRNLPFLQLLSHIDYLDWHLKYLLPSVAPAREAMLSGFLILVRHLLSDSRSCPAPQPPSTFSQDEALHLLTAVVPERHEGELASNLTQVLNPPSSAAAVAAVPWVFALAAFFGSNNTFESSQVDDFLKWVMDQDLTDPFSHFVAIPCLTVRAFTTAVIESAIRIKSVQMLNILFDSGVKLDNILDQIAALDSADSFVRRVLAGMGPVRLATGGIGASVLDACVRSHKYDVALSLMNEKGVSVDSWDRYNNTPLCQAIQRKDIAGVRFLLTRGADVNAGNPSRMTPFARAVELGHEEIVSLLLGHGPDLSSRILGTPILEWAWLQDRSMFKLLRDKLGLEEPRIPEVAAPRVSEHPARPGPTAEEQTHQLEKKLEESIQRNDLVAAQALLRKGVNPNGPTLPTPPLKTAMRSDLIDHGFVELLLEYGADANTKDLLGTLVKAKHYDLLQMFVKRHTDMRQQGNALVIAAEAGDIASAAILLRWTKVNIDFPGEFTPLQAAAAASGDRALPMVVFLLEKGADVNAPADEVMGRTALQAALESAPTFEVAEMLLRYGANAGAPPAKLCGVTALEALCHNPHAASNPKLSELIDKLFAAGATVNRPGGEPGSVLHGVVRNGMHTLLPRFLEQSHGAIVGDESLTQLAASSGDLEALRILLDHGADANKPADGRCGHTALQAAAALRRPGSRKMALVRLLLDRGADVNAGPATYNALPTNYGFLIGKGFTALHAAAVSGDLLVAELLIARGAWLDGPLPSTSIPRPDNVVAVAAGQGRLDMVQLLLNAGAAGRGESGLDEAIRRAETRGHVAIVEILKVEQEARRNRSDLLSGGI